MTYTCMECLDVNFMNIGAVLLGVLRDATWMVSGKKRKLPWTGITNWGTSSEKKQRRGAQKKKDGLSSAIYRTKSARRGFRILRRIRCLIEPDALVDHSQVDDLVFCPIPNNADGIEPALHSFDLLSQHLSQRDDSFVAHAKVLLPAIRDISLRFPCHGILRRNHAHVIFAWAGFELAKTKWNFCASR